MTPPPKLQAPGAGLPLPARLYIRYFGRRKLRRNYTWESAATSVEAIALRMYIHSSRLSDEVLARRVLVPPMRGLEDSSRYWSPAMVFQHLWITGEIFSAIILKLSRGETIVESRGAADVKPSPDANRADLEKFRIVHAEATERIGRESGPDRTGRTFPHPWFVPLTASDWYALLAVHLLLHERQWNEIVSGRRG